MDHENIISSIIFYKKSTMSTSSILSFTISTTIVLISNINIVINYLENAAVNNINTDNVINIDTDDISKIIHIDR